MLGFGDFISVCENVFFFFCVFVGLVFLVNGCVGIEFNCYVCNIELVNIIIFEGVVLVFYIIVFVMMVIMILYV